METENRQLSYSKQEVNGCCKFDCLKTVPDYLYSHYKCQPNRVAVCFVNTMNDSNYTVIFKELYEESSALAKALIKYEFVAVSIPSSPEWLYTVFGSMLAGAKPIFLSFTYTDTDGSDVIAMMKKLQTCSAIVLDPGSNWNIFRKLVDCFDGEGNVKSANMPYLRYALLSGIPKENTNVLTIPKIVNMQTQDVYLPSVSA